MLLRQQRITCFTSFSWHTVRCTSVLPVFCLGTSIFHQPSMLQLPKVLLQPLQGIFCIYIAVQLNGRRLRFWLPAIPADNGFWRCRFLMLRGKYPVSSTTPFPDRLQFQLPAILRNARCVRSIHKLPGSFRLTWLQGIHRNYRLILSGNSGTVFGHPVFNLELGFVFCGQQCFETVLVFQFSKNLFVFLFV